MTTGSNISSCCHESSAIDVTYRAIESDKDIEMIRPRIDCLRKSATEVLADRGEGFWSIHRSMTSRK